MNNMICLLAWRNLCSETFKAAKQDNGVRTGKGYPSRVTISRLTVIVFDKDDDCEGAELVDILSFTNVE